MKVLHIVASMDPASGGTSQGIRNSIQALGQEISNSEVVCLDNPLAPFLGKDLFLVHALGPAKNPWCYSPKFLPWLSQNLERFDAVVINGLWLYPSYAASKAVQQFIKRQTKQSGKSLKLFVMPHGMLDPYFQRAPERKLKAIRNWLYWKLIENKVVNRANGVLFTCQEELELARKFFRPYCPKKELNTGYGIAAPPPYSENIDQAFWNQCPQGKNRAFLLFIGRIHPKKGIDLLLDAYTTLLEQNAHLPRLVIAGPGRESKYGQKLKKIVEGNKKLSPMVSFPGMLTGDAKWGAFYGCEAFILPSHQENFGIAVVEALACFKPVLISNQVNIWKEINEEKGGIIDSDTLEGTRRLLKTWFALDKEDRNAMAGRAYQTFQKYFEANQVAYKFLQAISAE